MSENEHTSAATPAQKAQLVAEWLAERKAADVRLYDLAGLSGITEAMVLVTATSIRHAQGMAKHVTDKTAEHGLEFLGMEGYTGGSWILIDLNDVLVHIFQDSDRAFYDLEGLWSEAPAIPKS